MLLCPAMALTLFAWLGNCYFAEYELPLRASGGAIFVCGTFAAAEPPTGRHARRPLQGSNILTQWVKKSPVPVAGDVDKYPKMGYSIDTKGATSRRLPQMHDEK